MWFRQVLAIAPIIEEEKKSWLATYWPVILTITIVIIGVGICVYYYYPFDNGGNGGNNNIPDNRLSIIGENRTLNNIIENINTAVDRNISIYDYYNGAINENTNLELIFPNWGLSETQILEMFNVSKIQMVEFIEYMLNENSELFHIYQETELSREVVLQIKENIINVILITWKFSVKLQPQYIISLQQLHLNFQWLAIFFIFNNNNFYFSKYSLLLQLFH